MAKVNTKILKLQTAIGFSVMVPHHGDVPRRERGRLYPNTVHLGARDVAQETADEYGLKVVRVRVVKESDWQFIRREMKRAGRG